MRRRSSSVSSSLLRQRADGNQPSTAQMTNTASHSFPLAECAVLRTRQSSSSLLLPPGKSCVARGCIADAREQHQQAVPAHLIARILENAQERENILDVRRLEKLEPAPFLERDLPVRQLDLQIGRHVTGAKQHRNLSER